MNIGRLLRSSSTGYVFGCKVPEGDVPRFGDFVKAPAQHGQSEVIGVIYNIAVQDDAFVRPMVAAPDLTEEYVLDQRLNRQVPIEVSVLAVGYRNGGGGCVHELPPQPPLTLDGISLCSQDEICTFTEKDDYLRLIVGSREAPADELVAVALHRAAQARPPQERDSFLRRAGRELARLLNRDLMRLERVLRRIKP